MSLQLEEKINASAKRKRGRKAIVSDIPKNANADLEPGPVNR